MMHETTDLVTYVQNIFAANFHRPLWRHQL